MERARRGVADRQFLAVRPREPGAIVLENVWFRYRRDGPWVLKGFELRVSPREKIRIRGASGSGKTTVLRLLAGLYAAEQGSVTIAGHDPATVRHLVLYLPQFVRMYSGTMLENLRILSGYASRQRILDAGVASGLAAVAETLPLGYDTVLTAGATSLSGGQRQLVALTAAMASPRPILLLDETWASVDWLTRSSFVRHDWFQDKTVVYVSHDTHIGGG